MKKFLLPLALLCATAFASTFTTNYNLEKPGDGDTTWGSALRDNFDTIDTQLGIDAAHIADTTAAHAATAISTSVGTTVCTSSATAQAFLLCLEAEINTLSAGGSVDRSTNQTIAGIKTFSDVLTASGGIKATTFTTGVVHSDSDGDFSSSTIVNADISSSAAVSRSKMAAGTADHVLINDASGLLSSEAQLVGTRGGTGVSSTATFPTSGVVVTEAATETLTNKSISGATNTLSAIADTSLSTISTAGKVSNSATTAASANTASAIVARDGSGNFTATTITAALTGNSSTATALAANPSDCSAGEFANAIAASGNLTCAAPSSTYTVPKITRITSGSGTHTLTGSPLYVEITVVGGGGGGGSSGTANGTAATAGTQSTVSTAGGAALITAGGGGLGGSYSSNQGGTGGTVTLAAGPVYKEAAVGGGGAAGAFTSVANVYMPGGIGGTNGLGGVGASSGGAAAASTANTGAGGSGAGDSGGAANSSSGSGGGAGARIVAQIYTPASSYDYSVGAGGTAAGAGASGAAGGAGGSGLVVFVEYYQ